MIVRNREGGRTALPRLARYQRLASATIVYVCTKICGFAADYNTVMHTLLLGLLGYLAAREEEPAMNDM